MKKGIFRVLVCLVLICSIIVGISPIRAKAVVTEATLVYVAAGLVCAAGIATVGVMASPGSSSFSTTSTELSMFFEASGKFVSNGCVDLLRIVDDAGTATYYASAEFLEGVRSWLFETGVVVAPFETFPAGSTMTMLDGTVLVPSAECIRFVVRYNRGVEEIFYLPNGGTIYDQTDDCDKVLNKARIDDIYHYYYSVGFLGNTYVEYAGIEWLEHSSSNLDRDVIAAYLAGDFAVAGVVSEGLTAGIIPAVPIDGSSALQWSEEYGYRQLRVIPADDGSGDSDDSGDDKKGDVWFPLALGSSIDEIADRTQTEQWTGKTPSEFSEYTPGTDLEILDSPQIDGFPGIELAPAGDSASPSPPPDSFEPDPDGGEANEYSIDLTQFFPFCIPFDLYEFFCILYAEPETPVFTWVIPVPQLNAEFPITIDLSAWDGIAQLFRTMELLAFIIGLAILTRDKILRG